MQEETHKKTHPNAKPAETSNYRKEVNSKVLLQDAKELVIHHEGRDYILRKTKNGKLILTA